MSSSSSPTTAPRIDSIQILRALAAFAVVFHHVGLALEAHYAVPLGKMAEVLVGLGAAGVDLFFVISGYIIFRSTSKLDSGFKQACWFLLKRAARIFPNYWFWTSVLLCMWMAGLALKSHSYPLSYIVGSYLLIPVAREDGSLHPLLDQGWTLTFEVYFYIAFSLAITFGWRRRKTMWLALPFLFFGIVSMLPIVPNGIRSVATSPLIAEFMLGIAIGWLFTRKDITASSASLLKPSLTVITCLLWAYVGVHGEVQGIGLDRLLFFGLPCAMLVACALLIRSPVKNRLFVWLGDASYSIYLTHGFFTMIMATALKAGFNFGSPPADILLTSVALGTFFISSLAYRIVEQPISKLIQTLLSNNSRVAKPSTNAGTSS